MNWAKLFNSYLGRLVFLFSVLSVISSIRLADTLVSEAVATELTFEGSGTGFAGDAISAKVVFEFVTYNFGSGLVPTLQVKLSNTSSSLIPPSNTVRRGNLLTGLFFSTGATNVGAFTLTSAGFDGNAASVHSADGFSDTDGFDIAPAVDGTATDGTYQLNNLYSQVDKIANAGASVTDFSAYEYGLSTVALGLGGFSGAALGAMGEGADDFGIYAVGSNLSLDGLPSAGRLIEGLATFWIKLPTTFTSLDLIDSVRFTFGSNPDANIDVDCSGPGCGGTGGAVPEPGMAFMLLTFVAGLAGYRRFIA